MNNNRMKRESLLLISWGGKQTAEISQWFKLHLEMRVCFIISNGLKLFIRMLCIYLHCLDMHVHSAWAYLSSC